jgi:hypothetical protein
MSLTDILNTLVQQDTLRRVATAAFATTMYATTTPSYLEITAPSYLQEAAYVQPDRFYVHIPAGVKVHRAPVSEFGSNLFGLAYPATGDVYVRDDLQGDEYIEVLFHEVSHVQYPHFSEQQNRSFVKSILGERATIHHRLG